MGWGWGLGNFEIFSKESVGPPFHFVQNSPDPSPLKVTIVQDSQSNIQQQETWRNNTWVQNVSIRTETAKSPPRKCANIEMQASIYNKTPNGIKVEELFVRKLQSN